MIARRRGSRLAAAAAAVTVAIVGAAAATGAAGEAEAVAPDPNPWLQQRFLNMAHQGGEDEAPSNTLFAFRSAVRERGADTIELDVNLTEDGELVVIHDDTWTRTSCLPSICTGPGSEPSRPASEANDMTLAEVQALDAGYWFRPGTYSHNYSLPDSAYPYRGVRTGAAPAPAGYAEADFRIPTLPEVLDAFPGTPINVEIKMIKTLNNDVLTGSGCTGSPPNRYCDDAPASMPVADALAAILDQPEYAGRTDIIVVSFSDELIDRYSSQDAGPEKVALAPGILDTTIYALTGLPPSPDVAAFQVPPRQSGLDVPGLLLDPTPPRQSAHADGYAVHVWPNGDEPESEASYARLIALGIDGYMSSEPSRLHAYLCGRGIPRPDGSARCASPAEAPTAAPETEGRKRCKKGFKKVRVKGKVKCKKRKKKGGRRR